MKLVIPIYSMRSYETGLYSILKDGNFKLHINRIENNDILVIPSNSSDKEEFLSLGLHSNIIEVEYFSNAEENRKKFWSKYQQYFDSFNLSILTDITGYTGNQDLYNNFNITYNPKIIRPYIDKFFDVDTLSVLKSIKTTVLNHNQKDSFIDNNYQELSIYLKSKLEVNQKVISKRYFDLVGTKQINIPKFDIFFPFRLTDKAYKFEKTVEKYKDKIILITDPNSSYSANYENVKVIKPTKPEYYYILSKRPTIIYNEDPELVFHPGVADFIYFKCNIVSEYKIPTLKEVLIE